MPLKRWEIVLRVNITGPFLCSKAVIPAMIAQGGGSIVNITSNAGAERGSGTVGYSAIYGVSKAALDRFTWALAAEEGKNNIAVNAVKPWGVVSTEGMRIWAKEEQIGWKSPAVHGGLRHLPGQAGRERSHRLRGLRRRVRRLARSEGRGDDESRRLPGTERHPAGRGA